MARPIARSGPSGWLLRFPNWSAVLEAGAGAGPPAGVAEGAEGVGQPGRVPRVVPHIPGAAPVPVDLGADG
jgi:hypothetical protein